MMSRLRSLTPLLGRLLHLLGSVEDLFYRGLTKVPFSAGVAVIGTVLIGLLVVLFEYVIPLPSEVSTVELVKVLTIVVLFAWLFIWRVLIKVKSAGNRLAITGVGLLSVGSVLAFVTLPSHESTSTVSGGVAVLPPAPGKPGQGFEVGLSSRLNGCNPDVKVKFVVNGSQQYWTNFTHTTKPAEYQRVVIVLPGRYGRVTYGLGPRGRYAINDPEQVKIIHDKNVRSYVSLKEYEKGTGVRNLTVLAGYVREWPRFQRPVVIETDATWVTRKDVNDCNLQVPALAGAASEASLVEAEHCEYLNQHYLRTACLDPAGETGVANMTLNPGVRQRSVLQSSLAKAMATGSSRLDVTSYVTSKRFPWASVTYDLQGLFPTCDGPGQSCAAATKEQIGRDFVTAMSACPACRRPSRITVCA